MALENPNEYLWRICLSSNLSTYDPYDIWKTNLGIKIKQLFNNNRYLGIVPAALLSIIDQILNNKTRFFYKEQEFPIVRALAAQSLLNIYKNKKEPDLLDAARAHLRWLIHHHSEGYSGYCWGANMVWASRNRKYEKNTPFITNTPYVLEALIQYQEITANKEYLHVIKSVYNFISKDLFKQIDTENILCLSYAPYPESRPIINANSYALYSLSLLYPLIPSKSDSIKKDVYRIYNFISQNQKSDGSWLYYGDNKKGNFIDCFHTCFILKNLIKASKLICLPEDLTQVIEMGYNYLLNNFYDEKYQLFKRFSKTDKLSLTKFDLYDNAEMLNLSHLYNDKKLAASLEKNIQKHFVKNKDIFSVINILNSKKNKNMLRWAVMPYINALSTSYN